MENIKSPENKAELLELLEKFNDAARDVLAHVESWDEILRNHSPQIEHWDHTNGPDPEFMAALERGDHLDLKKMPL